jgi:hypothetical protein
MPLVMTMKLIRELLPSLSQAQRRVILPLAPSMGSDHRFALTWLGSPAQVLELGSEMHVAMLSLTWSGECSGYDEKGQMAAINATDSLLLQFETLGPVVPGSSVCLHSCDEGAFHEKRTDLE